MASPAVTKICEKIANAEKKAVLVVGYRGPKEIQYEQNGSKLFSLSSIRLHTSNLRHPITAGYSKIIPVEKRIVGMLNYFASTTKYVVSADELNNDLTNDLNLLHHVSLLLYYTAEGVQAVEKDPSPANYDLLNKTVKAKGLIKASEECNREFLEKLQRGTFKVPEIMMCVDKCLRVSSSQEVQLLRDIIIPPMFSNAAKTNDVETMKALKSSGVHFTADEYKFPSSLHVAASNGNLESVKYLLSIGTNVHAKDMYGYNALVCAVKAKAMDCIVAIKHAGGLIDMSGQRIGVELCLAVYQNDMELLKCYEAAGVRMGEKDYDNRTALHVAVSLDKPKIVAYLLQCGLDPNKEDDFGMTPIGEAKRRNLKDLETLMMAH